MAKRPTEGELGAALRNIDGLAVEVYRPPDPKGPQGVSNWKPADYLVWVRESTDAYPGKPIVGSHWFEVKDLDGWGGFPFRELRPAQIAGIHSASRIGIPYWLCVWWRRHDEWTISDAVKVLAWREEEGHQRAVPARLVTSIPWTLLASRFGVTSSKSQLASTLKGVITGEVD